MGLLLLVAIVSGVVLYAPFMRQLEFGAVRRGRSTRVKWLDLHNLLGVVTLTWAFVVGGTGMINTWADLLIEYWQYDHGSALLAPYKGQTLVADAERAPVRRVLDVALAGRAETKLSFIAFPGTAFSSPHHTTVFLRDGTPLTSKLLQPVRLEREASPTARYTALPATRH